jgi:flavin-dependent dehydrogenase
MVDPFCGEGIRHALDSAMLAAAVVERGLRLGKAYGEIRFDYELEWGRRWSRRRAAGLAARKAMRHPLIFRAGLKLLSRRFLETVWEE